MTEDSGGRESRVTSSMSSPMIFSAATAAPDCISTSSHTPKRSASSSSSAPGARTRQSRVENPRELVGRRQRDQFRSILESANLNDAVNESRLKMGNDLRQVGCLQQAIE